MNEYLTTAQASKILNVTRFTVLNWIKAGRLRSTSTLGGHQRIPKGVVLSALRQIKARKCLAPKPRRLDEAVNCWESKEVVACDKHNCNKCLVFKKKINRCFLTVEEYGSIKHEHGHSCEKCKYLAKHYPREKKAMVLRKAKKAALSFAKSLSVKRS